MACTPLHMIYNITLDLTFSLQVFPEEHVATCLAVSTKRRSSFPFPIKVHTSKEAIRGAHHHLLFHADSRMAAWHAVPIALNDIIKNVRASLKLYLLKQTNNNYTGMLCPVRDINKNGRRN